MRRRVLVTGGAGQVGLELAAAGWPDDVELDLPGRNALDLTSSASIADFLAANRFDCVINSAAWTAVDAAEDQVADCFLANSQGPAWLAEATHKAGIPLIHVSTDYVFDGTLERAYKENDPVGPAGVYGASKLAGEYAVRMGNPRSIVLRTAWVLSRHRANFLKTMLRLGAERDELNVVADQVGCPTSARDIAGALKVIALRHMEDIAAPAGVYHFVNAGKATWYELATTIFALASRDGQKEPKVNAIATSAFPTRARRPANSRLDCARIAADFGIEPRPWREAVEEILGELLEDAKNSGKPTL